MNQLDPKTRAQIVACLVEGNSIRATCRMTGAAKGTVLKLLADLGMACDEYQDRAMRNLKTKRVQCDEIWSFCYAKEKNVPKSKMGDPGVGSIWTWTAIDADSKLMLSWYIGARDGDAANRFMLDVASRMAGRIQLTTDAWKPYRWATTLAFDGEIDYAQLIKIYEGAPNQDAGGKYSQPECTGVKVDVRHGEPDHADGHAPVHAANQRLQQEGPEPGSRGRTPFHALQLLPGSPDVEDHTGRGCWDCGSRLDAGRSDRTFAGAEKAVRADRGRGLTAGAYCSPESSANGNSGIGAEGLTRGTGLTSRAHSCRETSVREANASIATFSVPTVKINLSPSRSGFFCRRTHTKTNSELITLATLRTSAKHCFLVGGERRRIQLATRTTATVATTTGAA